MKLKLTDQRKVPVIPDRPRNFFLEATEFNSHTQFVLFAGTVQLAQQKAYPIHDLYLTEEECSLCFEDIAPFQDMMFRFKILGVPFVFEYDGEPLTIGHPELDHANILSSGGLSSPQLLHLMFGQEAQ